MKHLCSETSSPRGSSGSSIRHLRHAAVTAATVATLALGLHAEETAPQRFHAVSNLEFADKYLTPRGMIVHNDGLTFQWLALGLFNLYHGDSFINDVTLVGGAWNDFSSAASSIFPSQR